MNSDGECFRVPEGEILAACRALYPTTNCVLHVETARATPTIPGLTSLMLRVSVTARMSDGSEVKIKIIYKRPAMIPKQLELLGNMELFEREVTYFRDVVPMLKRRCPRLSLVQCYFCESLTLVLEDLNENGFSSVLPDIKSLEVAAPYISLAHVKLVVRRLAELHAASLGQDWLTVLPQLKADALYDSEVARLWYRPKTRRSCEILATVMLQYLDPVQCRKHVDWLLQGDNCFNEISKLSRFVPGELNVLCHGDCHANNLMFKHDEQGNPTEVKFVDLQVFRYAPPSRDLLYFLYTSTSRKFRLQHEHEIRALKSPLILTEILLKVVKV
ncbi:hypothetical protein B566_EDAN009616 [Ephemera danica]|nr:hypothetical protein B566_EDAN009616 [Ephemera danica]